MRIDKIAKTDTNQNKLQRHNTELSVNINSQLFVPQNSITMS